MAAAGDGSSHRIIEYSFMLESICGTTTCFLMWLWVSLFRTPNFLGWDHWLQLNGFPPVWTRMWIFSLAAVVNEEAHIEHLWVFFSCLLYFGFGFNRHFSIFWLSCIGVGSWLKVNRKNFQMKITLEKVRVSWKIRLITMTSEYSFQIYCQKYKNYSNEKIINSEYHLKALVPIFPKMSWFSML